MAADPRWRLSGGAANADPNASLGGAKSSVEITNSVDNNLFDDVTGDEHAAGENEYRGVYVHNLGDQTLENAVIWISGLTPSSETEVDVAVAAEAVNATMATIANENTAPATVSFTRPVTKGTGLALGNIPAGQHRGVWIRRAVTAGSTPQAADTFTVRVEGDSL
jgi:hypothetical protein